MNHYLLTTLAMTGVCFALSAQTQILNYGFEPGEELPGVADTVNLYDDWKAAGGTFSFQAQPAYQGANAFLFSTPAAAGAAGGAWERVLRFTNLPLQENTSYRVSFYAQANDDAELGVAIMRGELNADMPLVCAPTSDGGTAVQQKTTLSNFSAGNYVRKTAVFWSPSLAIQQARFNEVKSTGSLPDGVFLRLSFLSAADYLIDNVVVEEANIAGVEFNGDAIRVDFGYATNAADLAKAAGGTVVVNSSAFTLTIDGESVTPESAEIKSDGYLYLFLDENTYTEEGSAVVLSYDGSIADLKYSTTVAPESWTNPNCTVLGFTAETGHFNSLVEATSVAYEEADMVSSDPEESSFELSETIRQFSATFNKEVRTVSEENGAPVATLTSDLGFSETLALVAGQPELTNTLVFERTGSEPLAKATYTVTIENVSNAKEVARLEPVSFSFEVGKVVVSSTTYTELLSVIIPGSAVGTIPAGWTVNNEGEIRAAGESYGSGPRTFNFSAEGDEVDGGLYIRAKWPEGVDAPNEGSALYGDLEGSELVIPEGDVELRTSAFMWKGSGSLIIEVRKYEEGKDFASSELVASVTGDLSTTVEGNTASSVDPNKIAVQFHSDGGRYLYKAIVNLPAVTGDSWKEIVIAGFTVYSYVKTEGESSTSEYVFQEKFNTVGDNIVPAAGSGWEVYDANVQLTKGSNGSGASSRVFDLSATNLPSALYFRMLGTAAEYYAIYGNGGDGEPTLELNAVKYQFSYYAVNWKSDLQTLYFQILDANDNVVYSREDEITPNINSSKNTVVDAQKVEFKFTPSAAGQYKLKFWASGEAMFGNISIMTVGSPATYWKNLLAAAVVVAQDEYTLASQDIFAGSTYNALGAAIAQYSDPDMHTPAAYEAAIAEVEALTKAMSTRRSAVSAYTTNLDAAATALGNAEGTKYAQLDAYNTLSQSYNAYKDVTAQQLEDDALIAANAEMSAATTLLTNMQNEIVGLLTAQLVSLSTQIVKLDEAQTTDEQIILAGNALTDDQDLAKLLKLKLTSLLYKAMAEGDPFRVYDAEYDQTVADSIDLTGFIQNADLYTTSLKRDGITEFDGLFPGWNVKLLNENQSVAVQFSWSTFTGSETHPITDAALIGSWGPVVNIAQTLDIVPVGVYSVSAGTEDSGDRVSNADSAFVRSTFQYVQPSKTDTMLFRNDSRGTYYDLTRAIFPGVQVPAVEGAQYGQLTYSATIRTYQSICEVDAFKLHITGKLAGFDYAAAAAAVNDEYVAGIDLTTLPTEAPVSVRYFNLSGAQVAQPSGICVKVENYRGGYMVVKKVVVK